MKKKLLFGLWVLLLALPGLSGCAGQDREPVRRTDTAMGTVVSMALYGREPEGEAEKILGEIRRLEAEEISWREEGSRVAVLNASAGQTQGGALSRETEALLILCQDVSKASEGAFDITIGKAARLWDIDGWAAGERQGSFAPPGEEELREALASAGYGRLRVEPDEHRAYLPPDMALDLGAVGKGAALDRILSLLGEEENITGAVVSVGGSILTYGEKPGGAFWQVGITDPREPSRLIGYLDLEGQWCVSTSGDYKRYVEAEGVRYHHILDPSTGYPADSGVRSVTVLTGGGVLSDALSTACFVLGQERGMDLAEHFGAEALFVDGEGRIAMTEGMEEVFHPAGQ